MIARRTTLSLALALVLGSSVASASLSPKPLPAEMPFISHIQQTLTAKYPKASDAEAAGYFRYTNEDDTGAISYVNLRWTSNDWDHPSQLWYDVNGNLLGADFSVPYTAAPPKLWGLDPSRWQHFDEHVHYVYRDAHGAVVYGHAVRATAFTAAGGSLADPQPETLVKMGRVSSASQVVHVFDFPNIWDLVVWVKPNPNGAFADKNPLVHPSASAEHSMD